MPQEVQKYFLGMIPGKHSFLKANEVIFRGTNGINHFGPRCRVINVVEYKLSSKNI